MRSMTWSCSVCGCPRRSNQNRPLHPQFLPDGDHFIYFISSTDPERAETYVSSLSGASAPRRLLPRDAEGAIHAAPGFLMYVTDGRLVAHPFDTKRLQTEGQPVTLATLTGERQPIPFLQTPSNELQGEVSPDGRWIAYTSDESGTWEVYVQRFPSGGWKRAISVNGGFEPHWRRSGSGNRLFYISSNQAIMAVDFTGDEADPPQQFKVALGHDQPTLFRNLFAVSADGSRLLIDSNDGPSAPITVVVNWPQLASSR
jgi:hypothetical protein